MRGKVITGIQGLDDMLYGGIPEANQVIVAGGPGSGKTLLGFEYLYKNAKNGNTGLMISLEENTDMIIQNASDAFTEFKDIEALIESKTITILGRDQTRYYFSYDSEKEQYTFGGLVASIESAISSLHATRVVIDSVSVIKLLIKDTYIYRDVSMNLASSLRDMKVTSMLTMEMETADKEKMMFQPEFFIYDGIISMYSGSGGGGRTPSMEIIKMRGASHSFDTVPYEISPSGINVLLLEKEQR